MLKKRIWMNGQQGNGWIPFSGTDKSYEETMKKLCSAEPLSIEELEELCDMRQCNMSSGQSDKRFSRPGMNRACTY